MSRIEFSFVVDLITLRLVLFIVTTVREGLDGVKYFLALACPEALPTFALSLACS